MKKHYEHPFPFSQKVANKLSEFGFMEYKSGTDKEYEKWPSGEIFSQRNFQKKITNAKNVCACNEKLYINAKLFYIHVYKEQPVQTSMEFSIVGEVEDEKWVDLKFYGLNPENSVNNYKNIEKRLVTAWDSIYNK